MTFFYHYVIYWPWNRKKCYPLLDASDHLGFALDSLGEEFNILQINFGRDGAKTSYKHFKNKKLGKQKQSNFRNEVIVLLKAKTHQNHSPLAHIVERFADSHIGAWKWKQCSTRTGSTFSKNYVVIWGQFKTENQMNEN